ncbi:MAG: hypothetical protein ACLP50_08850 [Solirubrobacteraceae bacterium]
MVDAGLTSYEILANPTCAGPPHLVGIVQPPFQLNFCVGVLGLTVFLQSPGRLEITFGAAPGPHEVAVDGRRWSLPAGRETTLRFAVAAGVSKLVMPVGWSSPEGAPALRSVVVDGGAKATKLY